MKIDRLENFTKGWYIGNFSPSVYKTNLFEVCYKKHKKSEKWDRHYHKKCIEINLLVKGKMLINGMLINEGDIFTIEPFYISTPVFLEDCEVVIIKTPSVRGDKVIIR